MASFFEFIEEDIEAKKTLISTLPANNKRDIKKYNEKIDEIFKKYTEYKASVKKYIEVKSKSFNIKEDSKESEELNNKIESLEHARFVLNPLNTYFEKMGFDNLIYEISNYYDFNFASLNKIISQFLDKFKLVGIELTINDFDCTCYVKEYMTSFLETKNKGSESYDKVLEQFEKIYWINPEIIGHIELNFRNLIEKYEKKFINYVSKLQKEVMEENKISNYEDCLEKLKVAYSELNTVNKETVVDIINLAVSGEIDINNFFEGSKSRTAAYGSLSIDSLDFNNKEEMSKFYEILGKLKINLEEYQTYMKFIPLIDDFKKEYEKELANSDSNFNKQNVAKNLNTIKSEISNKKSKLAKLNREIFSKSKGTEEIKKMGAPKNIFGHIAGILSSKNSEDLKQLKSDSIKLAQELFLLHKEYDREYFNDKVITILNKSLTVSELFQLYYSFDYSKKLAIKKVFELNNYDKINSYSDDFDLFAMDLNNVIIKGVALFEENNIAKVIVNKYRLDNINIVEENLASENIGALLDKVQLLLRINEIEKSTTTIEKIWFMAQAEKLNKKESKTE